MKTLEKLKKVYVLCGIDTAGTTVYLRSLHETGKWEVTADIEMASKCVNKQTAELMLDFYNQEIGDATWVIIPCWIEYILIKEE